MTGLEALGAISAIFQTVSFAREVFSLCYDFYDDRPVAFDRLSGFADDMQKASASVKHYTMQAGVASSGTIDNPLFDALGRTRDIADQLRAEVSYVLEERQAGSISKAIRTQLRYAKKKSKIAALKSSLEDCDTHAKLLLARHNIKKSDAILFQQSEGFSDLSKQVKDLVQQLVQQQARASEVVVALSADMTNLSTNVAQSRTKTCEHVNDTFVLQAQATSKAEAQKQLVESLEFPDMWQRQSQILDAEDASFEDAFFRCDNSDEGSNPLRAAASSTSETSDDDAKSKKFPTAMPLPKRSAMVQKEIYRLREWIHTGTTPFWINGHAGSGKSTLVKFLAAQEYRHSIDHPDLQREILTHYFWKAGNDMQKSKKGYFCSIVSQLLRNDPKRPEALLTGDQVVARKKHISDWSIAELQNVFNRLITASSTTFVIFIDGLDEVTEDEDLYGLLESLRCHESLPQCRFCVSSRPEYIIQKHLSGYPTIRVQELTYESMMKYTTAKLKGPMTRTKWEERRAQQLLVSTVSKAEGIFLWLVLVTDIIRRSLDMGKDFHDILQRLNGLPSRLEALFVDMWERMGDDFASDQKIAASYINVAVMNMRLLKAEQRLYGHSGRATLTHQLQLFSILFVVSPDMADKLFRDGSDATLRDQIEWLQARRDEMVSHCLGLLICEGGGRSRESQAPWQDQLWLDLLLRRAVVFVHRSAFDFFTETKAGQAICAKSAISNDEFYFSRAMAFVLQTCSTRRLPYPRSSLRDYETSDDALTAALALSEAVSFSRVNFTRAKRLLKDVCEALYYQRTEPERHFACMMPGIKHMLELLTASPMSIASTEIGAIIFFDHWAGPVYGPKRDHTSGPSQILVQKMLAAGAYPHDPKLSRTYIRMDKTSAFTEFLVYLWFDVMQRPSTGTLAPEVERLELNDYLAALESFLKVNPSLGGAERLVCCVEGIHETRLPGMCRLHRVCPESPIRVSAFPASINNGNDSHASSGVMHVTFAVDSGWLCTDILARCGRLGLIDDSALPKVTDQLEQLIAKQCYQTDRGFQLLNMRYSTGAELALYSRLEFDQELNQAAEDYLTNHVLLARPGIVRENDDVQLAARRERFQALVFLFWSDKPKPFAEWEDRRTGLANLSRMKIYEWPKRSRMVLRQDVRNAIRAHDRIFVKLRMHVDGSVEVQLFQ